MIAKGESHLLCPKPRGRKEILKMEPEKYNADLY
jgi:hypothetical protein